MAQNAGCDGTTEVYRSRPRDGAQIATTFLRDPHGYRKIAEGNRDRWAIQIRSNPVES
jgi:hypothetical protein